MIPDSDEGYDSPDCINKKDRGAEDLEPLSVPKNNNQITTDFDEALKLQASLNGRPL